MRQGHSPRWAGLAVAVCLSVAGVCFGRPVELKPAGQARVEARPGAGPAVVVGPEGSAVVADSLVEAATTVRLRATVQHLSGDGPLCVGTTTGEKWPVSRIPADGRTQQIDIRLVKSAGRCVYLSGVGSDQWLILDAQVDAWSPPGPVTLWEDSVFPAPLPAGWQPTGLLDARSLVVGNTQRLVVNVGPVRVVLPTSAQGPRGLRNEFEAQGINSADGTVRLTMRVEGPVEFAVPQTTVPIRGGQDIRLRPQFCSFWAGEAWAKVVMECEGSQAAAPLRVLSWPAYPAFGYFAGPDTEPDRLGQLLQSPVSIVMVPAGRLRDAAGQGPEILVYGNPDQLLAARQADACGRVRIACVWGEPTEWVAGIERVAAAQKPTGENAWLLAAGPLKVSVTDKGIEAREQDLAVLRQLAGKVAAIVATAPSPPSLAVIQSSANSADMTQEFWAAVERGFDPAPLREQLRAAGVNVPIAWVVPEEIGGGLAVWTRVVAGLLYQGATAILFEPKAGAQWPPMWGALMRELSAAVPVVALEESNFASTHPGAPVGFRPFVRDREGCIALWNSTGQDLEVAVEMRTEPMEGNMLTCAPGSPPVSTHLMPFDFQEEAFELGRPVIVVKLRPGEARVLNVRFVGQQLGWLRAVQKMQRQQRMGPSEDVIPSGRDWWEQLRRKHRQR
ncbi:MAG: hypothetical protein H5T86_07490 [Armatimonadetes bacterium]|nr:hypothetical protein [Armatimonadota bacterium]